MASVQTNLNKVELVLQALRTTSMHLVYLVRRLVRAPGRGDAASLGGSDATSRPHPGSTRKRIVLEREVKRPTTTASASLTKPQLATMRAYLRGELSEGQVARALDMHRITVREIADDMLAAMPDRYEGVDLWRYGDRP